MAALPYYLQPSDIDLEPVVPSLGGNLPWAVGRWPQDVEIEFCTRASFHTKHKPEKYLKYFNDVKFAFQQRYPHVIVKGNPEVCEGQGRPWKFVHHLGPAGDVFRPRFGAFEVTMRSEWHGVQRVFSKLESRCWPKAESLVRRAELLLDGGTVLLKPLPPVAKRPERLPGVDALKVRRNLIKDETRCERTWNVPKSRQQLVRVRDLRDLSANLYKKQGQIPQEPPVRSARKNYKSLWLGLRPDTPSDTALEAPEPRPRSPSVESSEIGVHSIPVSSAASPAPFNNEPRDDLWDWPVESLDELPERRPGVVLGVLAEPVPPVSMPTSCRHRDLNPEFEFDCTEVTLGAQMPESEEWESEFETSFSAVLTTARDGQVDARALDASNRGNLVSTQKSIAEEGVHLDVADAATAGRQNASKEHARPSEEEEPEFEEDGEDDMSQTGSPLLLQSVGEVREHPRPYHEIRGEFSSPDGDDLSQPSPVRLHPLQPRSGTTTSQLTARDAIAGTLPQDKATGRPSPRSPESDKGGGVDAATSEPPSETYSEHFATGPLSLGATSEVSSSHRAAGRDGDLPSDESYGDVFATALVSRARGSDVSPVQDSEMDASSDGSFARVDESSGRHRPLAGASDGSNSSGQDGMVDTLALSVAAASSAGSDDRGTDRSSQEDGRNIGTLDIGGSITSGGDGLVGGDGARSGLWSSEDSGDRGSESCATERTFTPPLSSLSGEQGAATGDPTEDVSLGPVSVDFEETSTEKEGRDSQSDDEDGQSYDNDVDSTVNRQEQVPGSGADLSSDDSDDYDTDSNRFDADSDADSHEEDSIGDDVTNDDVGR